ncbi:MAG: hypothetical protein Q8K70_06755 [Bacteroidota bacterium]|nr:hypothetical protein [Bacteroidota bacterium]
MIINVSPDLQVRDLKKQFHENFKFLKIECFKKSHGFEQSSHKKDIYSNDIKLSDIMNPKLSEEVVFDENTTVFEFENGFKKFGLNVQVFRKSGTVYIETSLTDSWTLAQQNSEGKMLSELVVNEPIEDQTDQDIWE